MSPESDPSVGDFEVDPRRKRPFVNKLLETMSGKEKDNNNILRVLVLGAQGLLGSSLVPCLQARGHKVFRHARKGKADVFANLTEAAQVDAVLNEVMPDVIVNLVALTNVDECERSPQHAYLTNVRVVENLVKWIMGNDELCHLVQLSTDQVYSRPGPHKEDDVSPLNYYGFSKYAGELLAAQVPSTVLRTNFIGPSLCPGRTSLSDWLVESLSQGRAITVFDDISFSPLTTQRLVELIELVVVKRPRGVFNLGSKEGMSKADFAFALAEVMGLPTKHMSRGTSEQVKPIAYRPKDMRMDSSRFEDVFGITLPSLREEICSLCRRRGEA